MRRVSFCFTYPDVVASVVTEATNDDRDSLYRDVVVDAGQVSPHFVVHEKTVLYSPNLMN